jgi:hypothetical protein
VHIVAKLAREFERDIATQAETDQVDRPVVLASNLANQAERIARKPGVVHGFTERLGSTAAAHIRAMHGEIILQQELGHTADVTGIARALKPVDHEDLTMGFTGRPLFVNENLSFRIGAVQPFRYRKANCIQSSLREVRQNRKDMRVTK